MKYKFIKLCEITVFFLPSFNKNKGVSRFEVLIKLPYYIRINMLLKKKKNTATTLQIKFSLSSLVYSHKYRTQFFLKLWVRQCFNDRLGKV